MLHQFLQHQPHQALLVLLCLVGSKEREMALEMEEDHFSEVHAGASVLKNGPWKKGDSLLSLAQSHSLFPLLSLLQERWCKI